jgi:K+-sensing histidine kinase KdpD
MTRLVATGLPRVRALIGAGCGATGLVLLTALLVTVRDRLGLAEVALLYLVPVMAAAAIGGLWPALLVALAADLLVNFFFVPPYHTLLVSSQNHVIVLIIYLLVAASFSVTVDVAARQRATAARRDTEARLLAKASAGPVAEDSLTTLLTDIRDVFGMTAVALLESDRRASAPRPQSVRWWSPGQFYPPSPGTDSAWSPGGRTLSPKINRVCDGWPQRPPACSKPSG